MPGSKPRPESDWSRPKAQERFCITSRTPSIPVAECRLGELPPQTAEAIEQAMGRAREAHRAGDLSTCARALADVQALIGPSPSSESPE